MDSRKDLSNQCYQLHRETLLSMSRIYRTNITEEDIVKEMDKAWVELQLRLNEFHIIPGQPNSIKLSQHILNTFSSPVPVILDLGCDDFPHYFVLADCFSKYKYIGIDSNQADHIKAYADVLSKNHPNQFHFINMEIGSHTQVVLLESIKEMAESERVDFILLENIAVGGSDNTQTDELLKFIMNQFIPAVLSESGSFHIEAASQHQNKLIAQLLTQSTTPFLCVGNSFICGKAALSHEIKELCKKAQLERSPIEKNSVFKRKPMPLPLAQGDATPEKKGPNKS